MKKSIKKIHDDLNNENGFVLVTALVILVVLTLLGIMSTKTTMMELMVSGNEKIAKQTFYRADGGTELAQELIFKNLICTTTKGGFDAVSGGMMSIGNTIIVEDLGFSEQNHPGTLSDNVSDSNREFVYYPEFDVNVSAIPAAVDEEPHTNFLTNSQVKVNPGSGLQMVSGYEGLGAGAAGGGTSRLYTIASQHYGAVNSQSVITVRWRLDNFLISSASVHDCDY